MNLKTRKQMMIMDKETLNKLTAFIKGNNIEAALNIIEKLEKNLDYCLEENDVLREVIREDFGCKRIKLKENQKCRLGVKLLNIEAPLREDYARIFQPETIIRWYRNFAGQKYNSARNRRKGGRPPISQNIIDEVLRLARQNSNWGYDRIAGVMAYLGLNVGRSTVKRILDDHGITPEPLHKPNMSWREFIESHKSVIAATDFFETELNRIRIWRERVPFPLGNSHGNHRDKMEWTAVFRNKEKECMMVGNKILRCVCYTRISCENGLEQSFNSLDAQREAAENYIASQRMNGWQLLPERYDDGGYSGSNMERPALKRLLKDIEAGKIDIVVVYKLDRLSRSLLDFMKLAEILEQRNVSFVSVTQDINTSSSAGRMMLNILMTFAQYEREIIVERIRDKVAGAKRRGKQCGGPPILGYDATMNL